MATEGESEEILVVAFGLGIAGVEGLKAALGGLSPRVALSVVVALCEREPFPEAWTQELEGTGLAIEVVRRTVELTPGRVLIIPQGLLGSVDGRVLEVETAPSDDPTRPIDTLFESVARGRGSQAVAVLMGSTGPDGLAGLAEIRGRRGLTLAQHEGTAPGGATTEMLRRAAEIVDKTLSPAEISDHLERFTKARQNDDPFRGKENELQALFGLLHKTTSVDFSSYKLSTVRRRVLKRMVLQQTPELGEYVNLLRRDQNEVPALYNELLVGVTELFRDPAVFTELESTLLPNLLERARGNRPLRVWVPGCSRGDEVYSIAICFLETFRRLGVSRPLQIFATDLNEASLSQARSGRYPASVVEDLPPSVQRYFMKLAEGYQISRTVRELCVFARQDVTQDPPFSNLDLLSCRNLLIYLSPSLQRRALQHFHYALRPGGFMVLGSSESLGDCEPLFTAVNKKCKIFQRRTVPTPAPVSFSSFPPAFHSSPSRNEVASPMDLNSGEHDVQKQADRLILARYSPPGVIVDENFDIVQFRGRTGAYLEPPVGAATHNVLKMAREGLLAALRTAMDEALATQSAVRRENVQVRDNGVVRRLSLDVIPVRLVGAKAKCLLILFLDSAALEQDDRMPAASEEKTASEVDLSVEAEILYLRHELLATREYLSSIIQERESANEELKAANEEAQSANEELQSANEELETAKEELQSTNEELATINEELHERNIQLHRANSDLSNILGSVETPVVILDVDLVIRRFTPSAQSLLNLIPGDIGRPFYQVRSEVEVAGLDDIVRNVLETLATREVEQQSSDGRWFLVQVRPYRTVDNRIDGAVVSFTEVTESRENRCQLEDLRRWNSRLLDLHPAALAVVDEGLRVIEANSRFNVAFAPAGERTERSRLEDLDGIGGELCARVREYVTSSKSSREKHQIHLPGKSLHEVSLRKVKLSSRHRVILEIPAESPALPSEPAGER